MKTVSLRILFHRKKTLQYMFPNLTEMYDTHYQSICKERGIKPEPFKKWLTRKLRGG